MSSGFDLIPNYIYYCHADKWANFQLKRARERGWKDRMSSASCTCNDGLIILKRGRQMCSDRQSELNPSVYCQAFPQSSLIHSSECEPLYCCW